MSVKKVTPTIQFSKMLEYGAEHTIDGISFGDILIRLELEGYYKNGQSTDYLISWFDWSFEHREATCHCPRPENDCGCNDDHPCSQFEHRMNCKYYLSKSALLEFLNLQESENNAESARKATRIGWMAVGIAVLALISPIIDAIKYFDDRDNTSLNKIEMQLDSVNYSLIKGFDQGVKTREANDSLTIALSNQLKNISKQQAAQIKLAQKEIKLLETSISNKNKGLN